ncbi:MAG: 30S ribosomal protein S6 [Planctomycetes bacterium]|nr:30S ribosomal protein S6 [Planctomycetota bacterium]
METEVKRLYEALFLVDSVEAASDWKGVNETIKKSLEKIEADIVSIRKWDERPLAYEIEGKRRGTYILVYFNVDGDKISILEREVQLSERIMRVLILRGDHLTEESIQKDTPAMIAEKPAEVKTTTGKDDKKPAEVKATTGEDDKKPDVSVEVDTDTKDKAKDVAEG